MQQLNPEEMNHSWQNTYGRYTGLPEDSGQFEERAGQKLDADSDEQFADFLMQKLRQELKGRETEQEKHAIEPRLLLALVSVCAVVLLCSLLIIALAFGHISADSMTTIGVAIFWSASAIIGINGYFNWASTAISKNKERKGQQYQTQQCV